MRFYADLHVHSKYSRATSRDLDLEHLAHWAARKGIAVVATGDFTHPAWAAELKQKLVPAEPGLYQLAPEIEAAVMRTLPASCRTPVRFMLEVEISTIYKKGDRTRKIHHLIYAPDLPTVDRISARLARIGNIASDGRPILGLDSRDLLEITLEAGPGAYLVPAHIWTPWFAALGSQSGFDSITECYGDLAPHIFAVETGLSSDPAMNWRLSMLDRYRLVSNSDAHSPGKLGREATAFDGEMDYFAIKHALETGAGYAGTVEFFPEEGKYHLDGHRKCVARLTPRETLANDGRCPVCGERVTVGVLHRVEMLADRSEEEAKPPPSAGKAENLVPLPEVLAEINGTGAASKAVERSYDRLVASLGPELAILDGVRIENISRASSSLLAEAITRLRAGRVIREAGYDGEYGVIRLFEERELHDLRAGGAALFATEEVSLPLPACGERSAAKRPVEGAYPSAVPAENPPHPDPLPASGEREPASLLTGLDDEQRAAAQSAEGALMIIAGPGSGKTRTLTFRIAHLVKERGVDPADCLAVTFTRRAAGEMRARLAELIPDAAARVAVHTFHSLGLAILRADPGAAGLNPGFRIIGEAERKAVLAETLAAPERKAERLLRAISKAKRTQAAPPADIAGPMHAYRGSLSEKNAVDFDDLVALPVAALAADEALAARWRERFRFISIDEFQDVDEQQYRLTQLLAPPGSNVCVIGDPNQAIYGFRGADAACFTRFAGDYPGAAVVKLRRNYRSTGTIVTASAQVIASSDDALALVREMRERIAIHAAASERAEAEFVVATIERLIGGSSFFAIDGGRVTGPAEAVLGFADIAVLCRTDAQTDALAEALGRAGIPFKTGSQRRLAEDPAVRALLAEIAPDEEPLAVAVEVAAARLRHRKGADSAAIAAALARLTALSETCGGNRARFNDAIALATDADFLDPRADRVSLITLHAAKGLEFAVVFIVGLEDGILPLTWGARDEAAMAEERRLFYVGMTRAKDRLILSRAKQRLWRGKLRTLAPSPFLGDIEAELLRHQHAEPLRRPTEDRQLKLF
ncbi:MAG: UvrD-helicase domain-containing protein [Hyphomicrobiales bacterium]|nr:UvrD-helicase domain-containing protein [Hyphomicrobiales bacterium]MBV8825473.1 UvrD-helicase domain-containing protein [Hyphomicrobiales bacterium]MBV9426940.1 UvrD-helicase domain-containing protein [Bradyrhizobiaceae bacterium]